jgi:hypothetical protein
MADKFMGKCSNIIAIKEMQIKMTLRFHFTPLRITTIKKTNKKNLIVRMQGGAENYLYIVVE